MSAAGSGASPIGYEQSVALTFHHVDYLLHASVRYAQQSTAHPQTPHSPSSATSSLPPSPSPYAPGGAALPILVLEAEQRSNGARWVGEFSSKYIEEMSLKTGNFKKFPLFVKMLSSALAKSSETVFIDLLTFQDLEALKQRKQAATGHSFNAAVAQKSAVAAAQNKRYIILTYVAEFDKVHYPLPLKFETDPNPVHLKQTIARLRNEVELLRAQLQSGAPSQATAATIDKYKAELYRLAEENHRMKSVIAARATSDAEEKEKNGESGGAAGNGASTSSSSLTISPLELEQLHLELRSLRTQLDAKNVEHGDTMRQLQGLMAGMPVETLGLQTSLDNMSKQVWNLRAELRSEQHAHSKARQKAEAEQEVMLAELERRLEAERLLRTKCRRMQEELEELRAAAAASSATTSTPRGTSKAPSRSGSIKGPPMRRPVSATPSPARGRSPAPRVQSRPGSRPTSRPTSAASSRASSPAPTNHVGRGRSPSPSGGGARSRSPSPSLSGRFDPSAYVKHKAAQLAAQQERTQAAQRSARAGRPPTGRSPMRSSDRAASAAELSPARASASAGLGASPRAASASARTLHSDRSRRSPLAQTQPSIPPRAPRTRPASATATRASLASDVSEADDDDVPPPPPRRAHTRETLDSSDEDREERTRFDRLRRKDNESIDQRFSALQKFLSQQKVDTI